jgi:hypothetical protein
LSFSCGLFPRARGEQGGAFGSEDAGGEELADDFDEGVFATLTVRGWSGAPPPHHRRPHPQRLRQIDAAENAHIREIGLPSLFGGVAVPRPRGRAAQKKRPVTLSSRSDTLSL